MKLIRRGNLNHDEEGADLAKDGTERVEALGPEGQTFEKLKAVT